MSGLPSGTITFLFADVEGSTDLVQRLGDEGYAGVLREYLQACRRAVDAHHGHEVDTEGDGYFAAFARATDAVLAAIAMQTVFRSHPWPPGVTLKVRIGMHTGEPIATGTGYVGVDVHRAARISAAAWGGQVLLSHATQALLSQALPADVSLLDLGHHRLKDLQEAEHLYQVIHADLPQGFSPLRSLSALPNNLPIQLTSFIGREREMGNAERELSAYRLVTLVGFGGVGKTRLALQVAADVLERFPDGVWLVELDALSDEALVPQAVASTLGVREESGRSLTDTLLAFLRSRTLLLILDNCEHVIQACARIAHSILKQAASVRILATSREPLGVTGEIVRQVSPLSLPDGQRVPLDRLTDFEAVRLFMERAAMARPEFRLTPENGSAIVGIAQRLGGIPLAIELAAARVKSLSITEVSARLEDALRLLTGGARTAVSRHRTLKAAIDWSHELLSDPERTVLRRVAVFRGGFALEAAAAICGEGFAEPGVPEILWALVEKSLLLADVHADASRYRLLDIIRQYGQAKAEEAGEGSAVLDRHLLFFLSMAQQAAREMRGPQERRWLDRLELEHDNLSAALERAHGAGYGERLLELAGALERFWLIRGYASEGRKWLEAGLRAGEGAPKALQARGLATLAQLATSQGDYERAAAFSAQGSDLYRDLADHQGIAKCLATLGNIAYHRGDYAAAWAHHSESLVEAREAGAAYESAAALLNLAIVADHQGEFDRATALCRESLQVFRKEGEMRGAAGALNLLGVLAADQGDYAQAEERFQESLTIYRQLGDKRGIAAGLNSLANVALAREDFTTAQALYGESLELRRELGHAAGVAECLSNLGLAAYRAGDVPSATTFLQESLQLRVTLGDKAGIVRCLERLARVAPAPAVAIRLLGAASKLREDLGLPVPPSDVADHNQHLDTLRTAVENAFPRLWDDARAAPLEEVITDALSLRSGSEQPAAG